MSSRTVQSNDHVQRGGAGRRLFAALMSIILVIGLMPTLTLPQQAYAADEPSKNADGAYELGNADELTWFANYVNEGGDHLQADAVLTADINLGSVAWTPIAGGSNCAYGDCYTGTFDGAGYTVTLNDSSRENSTTDTYWGLFGAVGVNTQTGEGGLIENLTLDGTFTASGVACAAGFTAVSYGARIYSCTNNMNITISSSSAFTSYGTAAAGIVAYDYSSTIVNCGNTGNISVSYTGSSSSYGSQAGGIIGDQYDLSKCADYGGRTCVENCYNQGAITSTVTDYAYYARAGGIAGHTYSGAEDGYIVNCYSSGATTASHNYSSYQQAGGIVGLAYGPYNGTDGNPRFLYLTNCYWADTSLEVDNEDSFAHGNIEKERTNPYTEVSKLLSDLEFVTESPAGASGVTYESWILGENGLPCLSGKAVEKDVASVTVGGTTTTYTDFEEALTAANAGTSSDPATLTLLADVDMGAVEGSLIGYVTFDLAGYTLTGDAYNMIEIGNRGQDSYIVMGNVNTPIDRSEDPGVININRDNEDSAYHFFFDSDVTFTIDTYAGYALESVKICEYGVEVTEETPEVPYNLNSDGTYTFTMPAYNVVIYATFTTATLNIHTTTDDHGSVTTDPENHANYNETVTVTPDPNEGYKVKEVTCTYNDPDEGEKSVTVHTTNGYTFTMPKYDVTVNVTFEAFDYTVTNEVTCASPVGDDSGDDLGTITVTGMHENDEGDEVANIGDEISFKVEPGTGYELVADDPITVTCVDENGDPIMDGDDPITVTVYDNNGTYTFDMPAYDVKITAAVQAATYTIHPTAGAHGTNMTKSSATYGETVPVTYTTEDGYELDKITVTDAGGAGTETTVADDGTFVMPPHVGDTVTVKGTPNSVSYELTDVNVYVYDEAGNFIEVIGGIYQGDNTVSFTMPASDVIITAVFTVTNGACAINGTTYPTIAEALAAAATGDTITLLRDVDENVTIPAGVEVTLDLAGHTLTNDPTDEATHTITNNGTLTITDSVGDGTIDNVSHKCAALYNEIGGECTILSGTLTRSKEAGTAEPAPNGQNGGNSYYTVVNEGTMTIGSADGDNSGIAIVNDGGYSSAIENGFYYGIADNPDELDATLTIYGGTVTGGKYNVKNDEYGVLEIVDGTFVNEDGLGGCILNYNDATISGGTFEATGYQVIFQTDTVNDYEGSSPSLAITGGTFNAAGEDTVIFTYEGEEAADANIAVSGGEYSEEFETDYLAEGCKELGETNGWYTVDEGYSITTAVVDESGATANRGTITVTVASEPTTDIAGVAGETVSFTISPNSGYEVASDGVTVAKDSGGTITPRRTGTDTYEFEMPADGVTITATLVAATYNVYTEVIDGRGSLTVTTGNTAEYGSRVEGTYTLPDGYKPDPNRFRVYNMATNRDVSQDVQMTYYDPDYYDPDKAGTWNFTRMLNYDVVVRLASVAIDYDVSISDEIENGSITVSKDTANVGDRITVTGVPDSDSYSLTDVKVTYVYGYDEEDNPLTAEAKVYNSGGTWSFDMPAYDVTVWAEFGLTNPACEVDGTQYATIAEALEALKDGTVQGDTIKLLRDVEEAVEIDGQDVTLDLNTYTLTAPEGKDLTLTVKGGANVTVQNGTIMSSTDGRAVSVWASGEDDDPTTLTVADDATLVGDKGGLVINGSTGVSGHNGCGFDVTVEGTVIATGTEDSKVYSAIWVYGNMTEEADVCNLTVSGTVTGCDEGSGIGIAGWANVTILEGANISGGTGIEARAGSLTVKGGTITATSNTYSSNPSSGGLTSQGAGIAVAPHVLGSDVSVTITGGDISGTYAVSVDDPNETDNDISIEISGGTFTTTDAENGETVYVAPGVSDVSGFITGGTYNKTFDNEYLADGYKEVTEKDGWYVVNHGYEIETAVEPDEAGTITITTIGGETLAETSDQSAEDAILAAAGEQVTFTVSAGEGYNPDSVEVKVTDSNGTEVRYNRSGSEYAFTMPEDAVTITATWSATTYNIFYTTNGQGEFVYDKTSAAAGDIVEFTVDFDIDRYALTNLTYSYTDATGKTVIDTPDMDSETDMLYFEMPASDVTVSATFEAYLLNIYEKIDPVGAGTMDVLINGEEAEGILAASAGDIITVTATPNDPYLYELEGITVDVEGVDVHRNGNEWTFVMPLHRVTITATFAEIAYNITYDTPKDKGTITYDKTSAVQGDDIAFGVEPNDGYMVDSVMYSYVDPTDGRAIDAAADYDSETETYHFTMPAADVTVTVTFKEIVYGIQTVITPGGSGTVNVKVNGTETRSATVGDTVTVTSTPYPGYLLESVTVKSGDGAGGGAGDGEDVTVYRNGDEWYFFMPADDVTITVTFMVAGYTISASATEGGSVAVDGSANADDPITVKAVADDGYKCTGVTYSFVEPGTGAERTLNATRVGEGTGEGTSEWTFNMPAANVVVKATFEAISYDVATAAGANGTISADASTATVGQTISFTVEPNSGYEVKADSVKVTSEGSSAEGDVDVYFDGKTYTFIMPASAVTISAEFEQISYNIYVTVDGSGSVDVKSTAYESEYVTITPTPGEGYTCTGVLVADAGGSTNVPVSKNADGTWTFEMPASDVTIIATFEKASFDITVTNDPAEGGSVLVTVNGDEATGTTVSAVYGDAIVLKPVAASEDFALASLKVNGTAVDLVDGVYTFTMPGEDVTVEAAWTQYPVLSKDLFDVDTSDETYTGEAITKSITTDLTEGVDYTVKYEDNVNAGTATITITGIVPNYEGEIVYTFVINPIDLSDATVTGIESSYEYTGSQIAPVPVVTLPDGTTLTEGVEYEVTYGDNINVGTGTVTISGIAPNYTGSLMYEFEITPSETGDKDITKGTVNGDGHYPYTGDPIDPSDITVTMPDGTVLHSPDDITVTIEPNDGNAGEKEVTITGNDPYEGEIHTTITVDPVDLSKADVTGIESSYEYTGSQIAPVPTVTLPDGTTLTEGVDYEVTYGENTEVGTGTVTISGIGNYTGDITVEFKITETVIPNIADAVVTGVSDHVYTGKQIAPDDFTVTLDGVKLVAGTDFTVEYGENVNAGTGTITLTGVAPNYTGTQTVEFTITPAAVTITANSATKVFGAADPALSGNVEGLVNSGDLGTITYTRTSGENVGTYAISATYTPNDNYTVTVVDGTFTITACEITKAMFDVDTSYSVYDGEHPCTKDITGQNGSTTLVEGTDYTVAYANNTSAGTATITIRGTGNYTGELTYEFQIIHYFLDVGATVNDDNNWYFDAVYDMVAQGVITGYGPDFLYFGVGDALTRADMITIMWRYCEPEQYKNYDQATAKNETGLPDVPDGAYYTGAVNWGIENGVITGHLLDDGSYIYAPDDPITFEQMILIIARYSLGGVEAAENYPTTALDNSVMTDKDTVSDWARGAMSWAIENRLVTGNYHNDGTYSIDPLTNTARERMITVFARAVETGLIEQD